MRNTWTGSDSFVQVNCHSNLHPPCRNRHVCEQRSYDLGNSGAKCLLVNLPTTCDPDIPSTISGETIPKTVSERGRAIGSFPLSLTESPKSSVSWAKILSSPAHLGVILKPDDFSFSLKPTHEFSAPTFDILKEDRAKGNLELTFGAAWKRDIGDLLVSSHFKLEEPSKVHFDRLHTKYDYADLRLSGNYGDNAWDVSGSHKNTKISGMYEGTQPDKWRAGVSADWDPPNSLGVASSATFTRSPCQCGLSNGKWSCLCDLKHLDLQVGPGFRWANGGKSAVTGGPILDFNPNKKGLLAGGRVQAKHREPFMRNGEYGFDAEARITNSGFIWAVKAFVNRVIK